MIKPQLNDVASSDSRAPSSHHGMTGVRTNARSELDVDPDRLNTSVLQTPPSMTGHNNNDLFVKTNSAVFAFKNIS